MMSTNEIFTSSFRIIILFCFILSTSCRPNEVSDNFAAKELSYAISSTLLDWRLKNETLVITKDSSAIIGIDFIKDPQDTMNSFFLDKESNDLIVNMLNYKLYDDIESYKQLTYQLTFEGYPDTTIYEMDNQMIANRYIRFEEVPKFYEFSEYALINMKYQGVMKATQFMRYLEKNTNVFDYKGSFWTFLYDYSKACANPNDEIYNLYLFIWFTAVSHDDEVSDFTNSFSSSLLYYIRSCKFSEEALRLEAPELMYHLDSLYGQHEK